MYERRFSYPRLDLLFPETRQIRPSAAFVPKTRACPPQFGCFICHPGEEVAVQLGEHISVYPTEISFS